VLILKTLEDFTCVKDGPFPLAACASTGKQVDDAKDVETTILREHGPCSKCEILWISITSYRNAAKQLRARSDKGLALSEDAGAYFNDTEYQLAAVLSLAFRNRARNYVEVADKEQSDFRKQKCLEE
jgi:hypothetical protein